MINNIGLTLNVIGILIDQLPSNFTPGESQNFAFSFSVVYISNPTSLWNI